MIKFNDVSFSYEQDKKILVRSSCEMSSKINVMVGPSGSGKSTIALMLNAINKIDNGYIDVYDTRIDKDFKLTKKSTLRKDISYVWQMADTQMFNVSVLDEITYNLKNFGLKVEDYRIDIIKYLALFNLSPEILSKSPFRISGGQKKKIAIISAIIYKPKLLILDEPTVSLDPISRKEILNTLFRLDLDILIITHDNQIFNIIPSDSGVVEIKNKKMIKYENIYNYLEEKFINEDYALLPTKYQYGRIIGVDFEKIYQTISDNDFIYKYGELCKKD